MGIQVIMRPIVRSIIAVMLSVGCALSQSPSGNAGDIRSQTRRFIVGPLEIRPPQGVFLLIRKGSQVGAIRFVRVNTGTGDTGSAIYESFFQGDGSGSFLNASVVKISESTEWKPWVGIGRLSYQPGQRRIRVGQWSFGSNDPGNIAMWPYRKTPGDYGYEFAPTSAEDISEVDATDKRLKWFRYFDGDPIYLSVSSLPK